MWALWADERMSVIPIVFNALINKLIDWLASIALRSDTLLCKLVYCLLELSCHIFDLDKVCDITKLLDCAILAIAV